MRIANTWILLVAVGFFGGCSANEVAIIGGLPQIGVRGRTTPPKLIESTPPRYPEHAVTEGLEGSLKFIIIIGEDGSVLSVRSQTQRYSPLEEAGRLAIMTWEFSPARKGGIPMESWAYQTVTFTLSSERAVQEPVAMIEDSPRVTSTGLPVYPMVARKAGVEGTVFVEVTLDENAQILDVQATLAEPPGIFEEAAIDCVLSWKFAPPEDTVNWMGGKVTQAIEFILSSIRQPLLLGGFRLDPLMIQPESAGWDS